MNKLKLIIFVLLLTAAFLVTACGNNLVSNEIVVGNPAPDFTLNSSDGTRVSLSDYKGQPVLLFFHMAEG